MIYAERNVKYKKEETNSEMKLYSVYCPQTDLCYYFNPKVFQKSIRLRVKAPKNYQEKNINFVDEYREIS
ncbi:group I intron-associated PD-(D/E)XK endonuclease [Bacillus sp. 103mf]|uniref:group I intron-associated PD-(D/E)XK endonuclease n=1 Tax=unclassified Bacillus (in: firmicutes) TaxID=185979 RepID=UPI00147F9F16